VSRWSVSLIVIVCLSVALYGIRIVFLPAQENNGNAVHTTITVEKGASFRQVASQISETGLIPHHVAFVALGKLMGVEEQIHPGKYDLNSHMAPSTILNVLATGQTIPYWVTIPEGYSMQQIGNLLEEVGITTATRFVQTAHDTEVRRTLGIEGDTLEGFLFPDTYRFHHGTSPRDIIQVMVEQFQQVYTPEIQQQARERGLSTLEVLTLASIIEKETGAGEERALISAVFHNRLKRGMPLQSDPTVIYALPSFDGNLRKPDLQYDSPYNTYRVRGLPPGPIANPGWASIMAALHPAPVPYLYFVSKNNGTHHFSSTLAEHSRAVYQYQKRPNRRTS
tara:strand:+ start:2660 stop:3670 length:1011 start_codon:yes stop_codon:yes gene_type:complete